MSMFGRTQAVNEGFDFETIVATESNYTTDLAGALALIAESEMNYANLMKQVGIAEFQYFEENGTEMVYEANQFTGFLGKLKEFFVSLAQKIKGMFQKFMAMINSLIMSDKDFVKKYRDVLLKADTKGFEYKGYNFTLNGVDIKAAEAATTGAMNNFGFNTNGAKNVGDNLVKGIYTSVAAKSQDDANAKLSSSKDDLLEEMRGSVVGKGKLNASEFTEELHKALRNGEDAPVEIEGVQVTNLIEIISSYKEAKKTAEGDMKTIETRINDVIKSLQELEKALVKVTPASTDTADLKAAKATGVRYISNTYGLCRDQLNILQTANGAKLGALRDQYRQAKALCVKLVNYKPKNEGYVPTNEGFLSNVVMK